MARTWSFYGSRAGNWQLTATWALYFCVPFIVFWSVPPREAKVLLLCYCIGLAIMAGIAAVRQKSWLLALVSLFSIGFYPYCIGFIFYPLS